MKVAEYQRKYGSNMYTSYGGSDIVASITFPGSKPLVFGELQTLTYSIHREKFPVRTLGRINPKGFSFGGRTIAGSLIFTVFDRHAILSALKGLVASDDNKNPLDVDGMLEEAVTDELPPFDITINLGNEYGNYSILRIYGVTIVDEGQVMSIEDIITENTLSYMATDIKLLKPRGE
jgi:hypothetical protein